MKENDLSVYYSIRDKINTGDLWLYFSSDLGGIITIFEGNQFKVKCSHSGTCVKLQGLSGYKIFSYESLADGFNPHFLSHSLAKYNGHVYWLPLKEGIDKAEIEKNIFKYDGTHYSYKKLIEMAALNLVRPDKDTKEMICSEAVEIVVSGKEEGHVHAPWELPELGYWENTPLQIL